MKWIHSSTDPRYQGTYQSWKDMRKRCLNPKHHNYHNYGGRGITVCERWLNNFDAFITDMGVRPDNLTIERIDVDGNYDPFNCIWETRAANNQNTRKAIAKRQRILENPPMEDWERTALREIRKPVKPPYVPQTPVHGSKRMYHKHKCRCEVCVASFRERIRRKGRNKSDEAKAKKAAWLREYRRRKRNGG